MENAASYCWKLIPFFVLVAALGSAVPGAAQTVTGQAKAIQTIVFSPLGGATTTTLVDTGTLRNTTDAREASLPAASVPSVAGGSTLHATTIGWPDQVKSEASLADLTVTIGTVVVGASFVMARASAAPGVGGDVSINGLAINGVPITVNGLPNQTINILGGRVVINEQSTSSAGIVVNALHITVTGVADVVAASATAGIH